MTWDGVFIKTQATHHCSNQEGVNDLFDDKSELDTAPEVITEVSRSTLLKVSRLEAALSSSAPQLSEGSKSPLKRSKMVYLFSTNFFSLVDESASKNIKDILNSIQGLSQRREFFVDALFFIYSIILNVVYLYGCKGLNEGEEAQEKEDFCQGLQETAMDVNLLGAALNLLALHVAVISRVKLFRRGRQAKVDAERSTVLLDRLSMESSPFEDLSCKKDALQFIKEKYVDLEELQKQLEGYLKVISEKLEKPEVYLEEGDSLSEKLTLANRKKLNEEFSQVAKIIDRVRCLSGKELVGRMNSLSIKNYLISKDIQECLSSTHTEFYSGSLSNGFYFLGALIPFFFDSKGMAYSSPVLEGIAFGLFYTACQFSKALDRSRQIDLIAQESMGLGFRLHCLEKKFPKEKKIYSFETNKLMSNFEGVISRRVCLEKKLLRLRQTYLQGSLLERTSFYRRQHVLDGIVGISSVLAGFSMVHYRERHFDYLDFSTSISVMLLSLSLGCSLLNRVHSISKILRSSKKREVTYYQLLLAFYQFRFLLPPYWRGRPSAYELSRVNDLFINKKIESELNVRECFDGSCLVKEMGFDFKLRVIKNLRRTEPLNEEREVRHFSESRVKQRAGIEFLDSFWLMT